MNHISSILKFDENISIKKNCRLITVLGYDGLREDVGDIAYKGSFETKEFRKNPEFRFVPRRVLIEIQFFLVRFEKSVLKFNFN